MLFRSVARYADSTGADEDHRYPHAWRYRDYVIDAFNRDLPYDQFVREQIAGDLMPAPDGAEVNTRGIVATGFLALGPKLVAEQDKTKMFYDVVDEQIDTAGKAILGLTIACARCHDHKFDPIPTQDYYSLAGMFASTRQFTKLEGTVSQLYFASLAPKAETEGWDAHKKQLEAKQKEIDAVLGAERKKWRKEMIPLTAKYMLAAREVYHDGRNLEAVRAELGFDNEILERWIEYLKPSKDRRAHLEAFYNAADFVKAASAYQDNVNEAFNKSKFMPGDYRFYTEITSGKGPLNPAESRFSAESLAKVKTLRAELKAIKDSAPPEPPMACGVGEGTSVEQKIFVRGDYNTPGDAAPRRFPRAVAGPDQPSAVKGSGRLEFAAWLTDRRNPLTARVLVNRLWQWHFGEGLVRTPNNFGTVGDRPSHPELLDYLAATFVESGWSVKAMHRLILNTRAYQMASDIKPEHIAKDSENRLLSRFGRRRLSVEEIRDSLLAIDGSIDFTMGGTLQKGEGTDKEFSEDRKSLDPDQSKRRLVYLPLRRSNLASVLNLFDFGDATTSNEARAQTNVAPQALFMMNSKFVEGRARGLAEAAGPNIESAYLRVLGRPPHEDEVDDAKQYIAKFPGKDPLVSFMRALIASNEFLYVH